jgi:hypothetical protein
MTRFSVTLIGLLVASCSGAESKANEPQPVAQDESTAATSELPLLSNAPSPAEADDPTVLRNLLQWRTKGGSNLGYDIFRADAEEGPFRRINERIVPGSGSRFADEDHFQYADKAIEPNKAYWYYVEAVDLMGQRSRLTPVMKASPKAPLEAPARVP